MGEQYAGTARDDGRAFEKSRVNGHGSKTGERQPNPAPLLWGLRIRYPWSTRLCFFMARRF